MIWRLLGFQKSPRVLVFGNLALDPETVRAVSVVVAPYEQYGTSVPVEIGVLVLDAGHPQPVLISAESARKLIAYFSAQVPVTDPC